MRDFEAGDEQKRQITVIPANAEIQVRYKSPRCSKTYLFM